MAAITGNTIRKGFRVEDAQLDGLLEELVRRVNSGEVAAQTIISRVSAVEAAPATSGIEDAPEDGTIYGRQDGAWVEVEGGTVDETDLAHLSTANRYLASQTVAPKAITSSAGVVTWNLDTAQNAQLTTTESITGWTVTTGGSGRFLSLRLSVGGEHTITWPEGTFYNMTTFQMPASGKVSVLSFRLRSDLGLEFLGQSPAFDEWELAEKIEVSLGLLAATGTGKMTRKATATATLPALAASGTIASTRKATMTIPLGLLSAGGTVNVSAPGTFAASIQKVAASGTAKMTRKGTATAALGVFSASGAGKTTRKATATATLPALAASGTMSLTPAPRLLLESGDYFLLESGDKLIL